MMTETPPPIPALPAREHRLHPWSWLFVALQHLKQFILPLLVLLIARRGDGHTLWPLLGIGALVLVSVWQYFTYRYRLLPEHIEIRSGLVARKLRQIAYARIHNVALHQTLLHRLFGVAEVRLESAGGNQPEAQMRVLRIDKALALEHLVRERGQHSSGITPADVTVKASATPLLTLPTAEIIRHGLISNRGMVVVAAGFATLGQFMDEFVEHYAGQLERSTRATLNGLDVQRLELGWLDYSLMGLVLLLAMLVLLRLLSVALSLLQYHGFVLGESGRRLTISRGLLSRIRSSIPKRRIQAWQLQESWLHRRFKRRALSVEIAASPQSQQQQDRGSHALAPIAPPASCDALINHLLPAAHWPPENWQTLHRLAWLRRWLGSCVWLLPLTAVAVSLLGIRGLLPLAWLPVSAFLAWQASRHAGWSLGSTLIATRRGWLSKQWRFAEVEKLQSLRLSASPVDRLFGMCSLLLDTAGASPFAPLHIDYLGRDEAEQLLATLARQLAHSPLRW
ncbi:MAG: PH domain-containing protein [Pseudomonadota bacterium]|nr:PH domain-containing protein [Pseudomonadota bacterium]